MALIKNLLNNLRLGNPINTYSGLAIDDEQGFGTKTSGFTPPTYTPPTYTPPTGGNTGGSVPLDEFGEKATPSPTPTGGVGNCPRGYHWDERLIRCVKNATAPEKPTPPLTYPDDKKPMQPTEPIEPIKDPVDDVYCPKLKTRIPRSEWSEAKCYGNDPTPNPDPIDDEVGGFRDPIEDEGGDEGDFYDRFPIDYDPSRFGSYQTWLKGQSNPLQDIFDDLGITVKDKYKKFFGDYDWFPESLAGTEFDTGRKDLTSQLFDLTRGSWNLRQNQGLLSGAPREMERLGMGQVGRQFQGMDTAYRKDIYGMRKGFEEDTINRLLDLMKSGAEPFGSLSDPVNDDFNDYEGFEIGDQEFYEWAQSHGLTAEQWNNMSEEQRQEYWQDYGDWVRDGKQ